MGLVCVHWCQYLRVPSKRVAIVSRKVFWGASSPFITGMMPGIQSQQMFRRKASILTTSQKKGGQGRCNVQQRERILKNPTATQMRTLYCILPQPAFGVQWMSDIRNKQTNSSLSTHTVMPTSTSFYSFVFSLSPMHTCTTEENPEDVHLQNIVVLFLFSNTEPQRQLHLSSPSFSIPSSLCRHTLFIPSSSQQPMRTQIQQPFLNRSSDIQFTASHLNPEKTEHAGLLYNCLKQTNKKNVFSHLLRL